MNAPIALPAQLNGDHAAALLPLLRSQMAGQAAAGTVVLDAAGVQRFDSATLALLLECRRWAQQAQRTWQVKNLPAGLQSMAHVYGVDVLLGVAAPADPAAVDDRV